MRTVARKPRTIQPAHGTARWLQTPATDWTSPGRLEISAHTIRGIITAVYAVTVLRSGTPGGHFGGQLAGFQLANEGNGEVYSIDTASPHGPTCDCPDGIYRERHATTAETKLCKHAAGLQQALKRLPVAPVPELHKAKCQRCGAEVILGNDPLELCGGCLLEYRTERDSWGDELDARRDAEEWIGAPNL
jgi:hypothetical protein